MQIIENGTGDNAVRLALSGDLVISELEPVQARMIDALASYADITLDLAEVNSCDTAGLQFLYAAARQSQADGRALHIATPSPAVEDAIRMLNLERHLPMARGGAQ